MPTARVLVLCLLSALPLAGLASGAPEPPPKPVDPDFAAGQKAIKQKAWADAVKHLGAALERGGPSADVHNLLGYAERQQGHLEAAFAHYEEALKLNPSHRGAHEYVGEAYLLTGNLAKAEEHLAALDKLCLLSCEEYRDLKKAIAAYKKSHPAAAP